MNKRLIVLISMILILAGCQNPVIIDKPLNSEINKEKPTPAAVATNTPAVISAVDSTARDEIQPEIKPTDEPSSPPNGEVVVIPPAKESPTSLNYPVPFTSQAPYAIWDELHGEACEEASMIMAAKYFQDQPLDAHSAEQEILNLIKWEESHGYLIDLTAQEASKILTNYFNLNAEVVTEVTVDKIKEELAAGKLIIVPAAGRELGNPYFQNPGPIYHMLVIRGYDADEFITNDPGTKRGEGFKYQYRTLLNAIHNWDHFLAEGGMTDEEINSTPKVMIVVSR